VPSEFIERMERAGYTRLRKVSKADLQESCAGHRYNGIDMYFGPMVLTVQPPMPDFPVDAIQ